MKRILYFCNEKSTAYHMGIIIRTIYFIFLAFLLCSSASINSDEEKKTEEVLLNQLVDPASGEIDKDTVRN